MGVYSFKYKVAYQPKTEKKGYLIEAPDTNAAKEKVKHDLSFVNFNRRKEGLRPYILVDVTRVI